MPPPSRPDYGALRKTAQEVDGLTERAVPDASQDAAAPGRLEINVAELRQSYATGLQVQVNKGRLSATGRSELLAEFDKEHSTPSPQNSDLQDALKLAAEARSHEAAERDKAYEIDAPEQ
jgi:hypothetical protein